MGVKITVITEEKIRYFVSDTWRHLWVQNHKIEPSFSCRATNQRDLFFEARCPKMARAEIEAKKEKEGGGGLKELVTLMQVNLLLLTKPHAGCPKMNICIADDFHHLFRFGSAWYR